MNMGWTVAGAAQGTDGRPSLAVAALRTPGNSSDGAVYLFHGELEEQRWSTTADLELSGAEEGWFFGWDLAWADLGETKWLAASALNASVEAEGGGAVFLLDTEDRGGQVSIQEADVVLTGDTVDGRAGAALASVSRGTGQASALLVGADSGIQGNDDWCGAYYVELSEPLTGTRSLADATAILILKEGNTSACESVAAAGDVDGDGQGDLLVGGSGAQSGHGGAYLVDGPISGTVDLLTSVTILGGEEYYDQAGEALVGPGNVDGDGYDDILIGAWKWSSASQSGNQGRAYVVLGPVSASLDLGDADIIVEGRGQEGLGYGVEGLGDPDADGRADFALQTVRSGPGHRNSEVVYLLSAPGLGHHFVNELAHAAVLPSHPHWASGIYELCGGQDLTGDGWPDLLLSEPYEAAFEEWSGQVVLAGGSWMAAAL